MTPDSLPKYNPSLFDRIGVVFFHVVNRFVPWHKLPAYISAFNLYFLRVELRKDNLIDGYDPKDIGVYCDLDKNPTLEHDLHARNSNGLNNMLSMPRSGCPGMRFGRNFPREYCKTPKTDEELMTPNPRLVSSTFMRRKPEEFKPATTLNLLAVAWIQFQVHDWMMHPFSDEKLDIPKPDGEQWVQDHMELYRTKPDKVISKSYEECKGFVNTNTSWWDLSQLYGSNEQATTALRTSGGKIQDYGEIPLANRPDAPGQVFLQRNADNTPDAGFNDNWWTGLELLTTLFALEHNYICGQLRKEYPTMSGQELFDKARLINCALSAKWHTLEWTPAILSHPALILGMPVQWWGLAGETITKDFGRLPSSSDLISGIPGSEVDVNHVPYSLTEEFVSVYRMHSLLPDNVAFFSSTTGSHKTTIPVSDLIFSKSLAPADAGLKWQDMFYTFGINYAGAITNNNYPAVMQELRTPDGQVRDMGTVDILRDRERGVPRYTMFRKLLRMSVPKTFLEIANGDTALAEKLQSVYKTVDQVDALVGCHCEPLPRGFAFSDTAHRIFNLMASRRLKSDRYIASWSEDMYTALGIHHVQNTTMKDVLKRHFPDLGNRLPEGSVFAPWDKMERSKDYKGLETTVAAAVNGSA